MQAEFTAAQQAEAGVLYPYTLTPSPGEPFQGNVWPADPRSRAYARAVQAVPDLAQSDVRFLVVRPGDEPPPELARIPHDGGTLTVRHWGPVDALSGESIAACTWRL